MRARKGCGMSVRRARAAIAVATISARATARASASASGGAARIPTAAAMLLERISKGALPLRR
jgi:hypothetical protein